MSLIKYIEVPLNQKVAKIEQNPTILKTINESVKDASHITDVTENLSGKIDEKEKPLKKPIEIETDLQFETKNGKLICKECNLPFDTEFVLKLHHKLVHESMANHQDRLNIKV